MLEYTACVSCRYWSLYYEFREARAFRFIFRCRLTGIIRTNEALLNRSSEYILCYTEDIGAYCIYVVHF